MESLKSKLQKVLASYRNILTEMKDINNNGDRFSQWIETLPYPIATILKLYSVSEELYRKQEILFYFFEAYAIFEATILSAALNKKLVDCSSLSNVDPSFFEKAAFGSWVRMDIAISKLFRNMINSKGNDKDCLNDDLNQKIVYESFKTSDKTLIQLICNKTVGNILDTTCKYRNNWKGHSGITNEILYQEHVDTLDSLLDKLRDSLKDLYERLRLVRCIDMDYSDGVFTNKVEILTGSNPIFTKDVIETTEPLDKKKLYIQMLDTNEMLELPPYFILKNSQPNAKNAVYFYNRVDSGNTRLVSYHYDGKPEIVENGEGIYNLIKDLLSN